MRNFWKRNVMFSSWKKKKKSCHDCIQQSTAGTIFMMASRKAQLRFKFFENFSNPEKRVLFPHEKNVESFDKIQTIKGEKYPAVISVSKVSCPSTTSNSHKGTRRVLKRGWKMFSVAKKEKLKLQFRRRGRNKTLKCTMPRFFLISLSCTSLFF